MSWMEYTLIGVVSASVLFFLVIIVVSYLEGWKWRRPK